MLGRRDEGVPERLVSAISTTADGLWHARVIGSSASIGDSVHAPEEMPLFTIAITVVSVVVSCRGSC